MRMVNLSRRPFLNTRPVQRLVVVLWFVSGLLLLGNIALFGSHFMGSFQGQDRLQLMERQIDQEQEVLQQRSEDLKALDLSDRNGRASYLNTLIDARVFPWSALFGALEDVLPMDVYLSSVKPSLAELKKGGKQARRGSNKARTAKAARERARSRARGEVPDEKGVMPNKADPDEGLVKLTLEAAAKTDDAMFELIENLYGHPSFERPELHREATDEARAIRFGIEVYYRPPVRGTTPLEEGEEARMTASSQSTGTERETEFVRSESSLDEDGRARTADTMGQSDLVDERLSIRSQSERSEQAPSVTDPEDSQRLAPRPNERSPTGSPVTSSQLSSSRTETETPKTRTRSSRNSLRTDRRTAVGLQNASPRPSRRPQRNPSYPTSRPQSNPETVPDLQSEEEIDPSGIDRPE